MVGKIISSILVSLLLVLILILLTPVRVRFFYNQGDPVLRLQFGPIKFQLFPRPEKSKKKKKKKSRKKQEKEEEEKPKKNKAKINREQIFYALEKLPPILGRALKRTGKSFRIEPLKVYVLVAGYDPADTALLYGRLEAALAAGLPLLQKIIKIRDEDVRLYLDFTEQQIDILADVGIMLRPWSVVSLGIRALASLIKWYLGFRKLASPAPAVEEEAKQEPKDNTSAAV